MDCEIILPAQVSQRGRAMLLAMIAAAPVPCFVTESYQHKSRWLMSYGLGHPVRRTWTQAHVKSGGRLIGWDLGYWQRDSAMRLTLDQDHPQRHLVDMPATRWNATGLELRNDLNPLGPIILCGLGRKQRELKGQRGQAWELHTLAAIRAAYPGRLILYRPKRPEALRGCATAIGTIEEVLRGASLVVCGHSNVAVDACIAGVPVVCTDGAAAALYGSNLNKPCRPDAAQRRRFLENLAWWNWKPNEAADAWTFLLTRLSG